MCFQSLYVCIRSASVSVAGCVCLCGNSECPLLGHVTCKCSCVIVYLLQIPDKKIIIVESTTTATTTNTSDSNLQIQLIGTLK